MKNGVRFSIARSAQWAPGLFEEDQWQAWASQPSLIPTDHSVSPPVVDMPAMLRRRARFLGRMALQVSYSCLADLADVPMIFASRHGEVDHSVELLQSMLNDEGVSPIGFSGAVHNATAGLFSIAKKTRSNHLALAAGTATVEHAIIEACSLLADGCEAVLVVHFDQPLPEIFSAFEDRLEQAFAWAWLVVPATTDYIQLEWEALATEEAIEGGVRQQPSGLDVLGFYLRKQETLMTYSGGKQWKWSREHVVL